MQFVHIICYFILVSFSVITLKAIHELFETEINSHLNKFKAKIDKTVNNLKSFELPKILKTCVNMF